MAILAPSPAETMPTGNAQIFSDIVELEGYLDHLNDRYASALSVTSRFATAPLKRNLLERSREHVSELRDLLSQVCVADIPDRRRTAWDQAKQAIDAKVGTWLAQCSQSLGGGYLDDNLGISARMIALTAMWDAQIPLTSKS